MRPLKYLGAQSERYHPPLGDLSFTELVVFGP